MVREMKIFRDIADPPAEATFGERIDWAAARDPLGHRVHLTLAVLALCLIPLSSSLATIGSTILFIYAALRAPTIHRTWRPLRGNTALLAVICLYGWLAVTLAWSEDPEHGVRLLRGSRYLLLVPALLPLLRHAHVLLWAICAGVLLQNVVQWFESEGTGGLSEHAGYTALWFTLATGCLILAPSGAARSRKELLRRSVAVVPMIGIALSTARSALLGGVLGLMAGAGLAWLQGRTDRRAVLAFSLVTCTLGIGLTLSPATEINQRMQEAVDATDAAGGLDVTTHKDQVRTLWWRIGIEALSEHPIAGEGLGSTETTIGSDPQVLRITEGGTVNTWAMRDDYHSLFVSVGAAGGTIGLLLLLVWLAALLRQILRSGPLDAVLLCGFTAFMVFSLLNTTLWSGRLVAFAAILTAFSVVRLPEQRTVREATAEAS